MQIVIPGNMNTDLTMTCGRCGCVFTIKPDELQETTPLGQMHEHVIGETVCPYCGFRVYKYRKARDSK